MKIQVTSDNMELNDTMYALTSSKLEKIEKYFDAHHAEHVSLRVVLNKSGADAMFVVKIDMDVGKTDIFGSSEDFSLESALIGAVDDVLRQYKKFTEKRNTKDWKDGREVKRFSAEEILEQE